MKILAIMGSPRIGESYKIIKLVEELLKKHEDIEFETLLLKDYDLGQCRGCHLCIFKEGHSCPLNNDVPKIEAKMQEADGLVMITPLYSQHVTALLKNFIDQLSYLWHRPRYFGKKAMVIATGGGVFKETLNFMEETAKHWGYHVTGKVGIPHLDSLTDSYKAKIMAKLSGEIDSFYYSIKNGGLPTPSLGDIMWFEIWKGNSIALKKAYPADFDYWNQKGWIDDSYYYPTHISVWKKAAVRLVGMMGGNFMKKMYKDY